MRILYEKTLDGVCLQRCYGLDKILEIPGTVDGMPVTEFAGYLFFGYSAQAGTAALVNVLGRAGALRQPGGGNPPLPDTIRKVGAYGFYNCSAA